MPVSWCSNQVHTEVCSTPSFETTSRAHAQTLSPSFSLSAVSPALSAVSPGP